MDLPSWLNLMIFLATATLVGILIYIMYINGFGYVGSMSSLFNYQTNGIFEDSIHANLKRCSGRAKKVFKVRKSGFYDFNLENELESGNVTVSLVDSIGNTIFNLDKVNSNSNEYLNESEKYRLIFNYNKACGKFDFSWK